MGSGRARRDEGLHTRLEGEDAGEFKACTRKRRYASEAEAKKAAERNSCTAASTAAAGTSRTTAPAAGESRRGHRAPRRPPRGRWVGEGASLRRVSPLGTRWVEME